MGAASVVGQVRRTLEGRALLVGRAPHHQLARGAQGTQTRGAQDAHKIVVACSGGADSAGLLLALTRLADEMSLDLLAASVDHGLRASAADDVAIAASQAAQLGVPFRALAVQVPRTGSLQAAARDARYAALLALAAEEGAALVAVGHTRDDQAETVLARLLRGGSLRGVAGIAPRRADGVIRPLLDCSRADVRALVLAERLPFVDDPSNVDPRFLRARLRADVMPPLRALDPQLTAHLADLADDARAADRAVRSFGARLLARAGLEAPAIDVLRSATPAALRAALAAWVRARTEQPAARAHIEALERLTHSGQGEVRLARGWLAKVVEARLTAAPGHAPLRTPSAKNLGRDPNR